MTRFLSRIEPASLVGHFPRYVFGEQVLSPCGCDQIRSVQVISLLADTLPYVRKIIQGAQAKQKVIVL